MRTGVVRCPLGSIITSPCSACAGRGAVDRQRTVIVTFPAGIDSGQRLRVPGQGMPGPSGAPSGDLYVDVTLEPHPDFERDGADLVTRDSMIGTGLALTKPCRCSRTSSALVQIS